VQLRVVAFALQASGALRAAAGSGARPVPLQRWQSICRKPSPTQFVQPRPQHSEISSVPTP
jgi:hypothetical protein